MKKKDVFICYAGNDKEVAWPLAQALEKRHLNVWIDKDSVRPGESLEVAIRKGLSECRYGVVILSKSFFEKHWPLHELSQLLDYEATGNEVIIPVWNGITEGEIARYSTKLANRAALNIASGIEQIAEDVANRTKQRRISLKPIVTFGSGNGELILTTSSEVELGAKHQVGFKEFFGGSAVNHSLRLLKAGYPVLPVLSIGNDRIGHSIQKMIHEAALTIGVPDDVDEFIQDSHFFAKGINTPTSVVVVQEGRRTIFSQSLPGADRFLDYLDSRISDVLDATEPCGGPGAIIIGHIYGDAPTQGQLGGMCTRKILDAFQGICPVYANFGNTQIGLGLDHWKDVLKRIDTFQLNILEARRFMTSTDDRKTLSEILSWFAENEISTVITLDRFGAVATHKDGNEAYYFAWPAIERQQIIDTTGAGDAFAAGMVAELSGKSWNSANFSSALETARVWAALACMNYGASEQCPDLSTVMAYKRDAAKRKSFRAIEVQTARIAEQFIELIDLAYR